MRVINRFVPSGVSSSPVGRTSFATSQATVPLNQSVSRVRQQDGVSEFLAEFGPVNKPFLSSAAGRLQPIDRERIQRGYIRRANQNNAANPLSNMSLRFMYNPATIDRQYAAYLDQAAIDPFNTIFQSGNLVAPPSFIEFSFELMFDRFDETTTTGVWTGQLDWPNVGVLHDYQYFDAVVRNVPPAGTPNTVPDNGVMMVNPEDIVVVFSKDLTVQGRPTNASVSFVKFTHKMVPTRMVIKVTMIANYFGPLREPFGLDASQDIARYQALIPYDEAVTDGLTNTRTVEEAIRAYQSSESSVSLLNSNLVNTRSTLSPWWTSTPVTPGDGSAPQMLAMTTPFNSSLQLKALANAQALVAQGGNPQYDQGRRTQHGGASKPWYFDCSSFVWKAYDMAGAGKVFGNGKYPPTAAMLNFFKSSNWSTVQIVTTVRGVGADRLRASIQPGDILFEAPGHIALAVRQEGSGVRTIAARSGSSNPEVGEKVESFSYILGKYTHILRPKLVGSQSLGGAL